MSPPRQVRAGFPIWLLQVGADPIPGDRAAWSPHPCGGEKGSCAAASLLHTAPPRMPNRRPGLSPALALAAEMEPRSVLLVRCSRRGG